ncbi:hypothetical protein [Marinilabilia rubra]|uniref:PKD domain-containing protein n=1 Tax=Marinilabilia rubra TaxID=2162893 RepID=A0A2U2B7J5_9BACT|nr:hypothetical protein [Marinilabilia rubra]PWD99040.1 hypothetical protein DDZ16_12305 [Marinilabilia rubra]
MMKNISIIIAGFFSLLLGVSCEKDEYVAPESFSDVTWYTSIRPGTPYQVSAGGFVSFRNPSPGKLTHQWEIEEGNFFLKEGFTRNDSVLDSFIDEDAGLISEETTVHVLFSNPGINRVRLYTTFEDSVAFTGEDTLYAEKVDDLWIIDKTFEIDVFDSIRPAFKVLNGDEEIINVSGEDGVQIEDSASWPEITIEAGESLTYVDLTSNGRPNARTWNLMGGKPSSGGDSIVTVSYYKMGSYFGSISSRRQGNELPPGSAFKYIPLKINVVKSSQPFVFDGNLMEHESEKISFNVTGETAPFFNEEDNFIVNVSNDVAGFEGTIEVESVEVNPNDATIIELTLAESIYNTDLVTVSYSGGAIMSLDERPLEDFGPETVQMYLGASILSNQDVFGFETPADKNGGALGWWGQHPQWSRSEDQSVGSASMQYQIDDYSSAPNVSTLHGTAAELGMSVPPGKYRMSLKVWIDPGTTIQGIRTPIIPWNLIQWDISNANKGEWVTLSKDFTFDKEYTEMKLQVHKADNSDVSGPQLLYVDDISFVELEERP